MKVVRHLDRHGRLPGPHQHDLSAAEIASNVLQESRAVNVHFDQLLLLANMPHPVDRRVEHAHADSFIMLLALADVPRPRCQRTSPAAQREHGHRCIDPSAASFGTTPGFRCTQCCAIGIENSGGVIRSGSKHKCAKGRQIDRQRWI
jgi:hypothetical protein